MTAPDGSPAALLELVDGPVRVTSPPSWVAVVADPPAPVVEGVRDARGIELRVGDRVTYASTSGLTELGDTITELIPEGAESGPGRVAERDLVRLESGSTRPADYVAVVFGDARIDVDVFPLERGELDDVRDNLVRELSMAAVVATGARDSNTRNAGPGRYELELVADDGSTLYVELAILTRRRATRTFEDVYGDPQTFREALKRARS